MIAVSAWRARGRKRHKWEPRSFGLGVLSGAALAGGISLAVEHERVIGLGFSLVLVVTLVLLAFAMVTRR
jgi:hypothetical protein